MLAAARFLPQRSRRRLLAHAAGVVDRMASGGVLMKIGGLVVKTLAKPVAKQLKADAETVLWLGDACRTLGQGSH